MSEEITVEQNDEGVDVARIESLLEDLNKSVNTVDPSVEIISKGADAIVEQNQKLVEEVEKSIISMMEKLDSLVEKVSQLDQLSERVEKGFADIASQPLPAKAVTSEAELSPADVQPEITVTKADVLSKAIQSLQSTNDPSRLAELRKGIARLESNYNPALIAQELSL